MLREYPSKPSNSDKRISEIFSEEIASHLFSEENGDTSSSRKRGHGILDIRRSRNRSSSGMRHCPQGLAWQEGRAQGEGTQRLTAQSTAARWRNSVFTKQGSLDFCPFTTTTLALDGEKCLSRCHTTQVHYDRYRIQVHFKYMVQDYQSWEININMGHGTVTLLSPIEKSPNLFCRDISTIQIYKSPTGEKPPPKISSQSKFKSHRETEIIPKENEQLQGTAERVCQLKCLSSPNSKVWYS